MTNLEQLIKLEHELQLALQSRPLFPTGLDLLNEGPLHARIQSLIYQRDQVRTSLERERQETNPREASGELQIPSQSQKVQWLGTKREFEKWISSAFLNGKLKASSRADALNQAAKLFIMKDGSTTTGRNLIQNRSNQINEGKG